MKKFTAAFALFLLALPLALTGCFSATKSQPIVEDYVLPDTYLLTYEIQNDDGTLTFRYSEGLDKHGNVYIKDTMQELLFINKGDNLYDQYFRGDDGWNLISGGANNTVIAYAKQAGLSTYIGDGTETFNKVTRLEDGTILGRPCTYYEATQRKETSGATYLTETTYKIAIDSETRICLSKITTQVKKVNVADGVTKQNSGFVCTQFKTDDPNNAANDLNFADWIS